MRFRGESPHDKPVREDQSEYSEFEEEIKPPVRKRMIQIVIAILTLTTLVLAVVAKSLSDQNQQVTLKAAEAIHAQRTAEAQLNMLTTEVSHMTATTQSPGVVSGTQGFGQIVPDSPDQTRSRELAYVALTQLNEDPERSILIALEANQAGAVPEAEDALRRALQASHIRLLLSQPGAKIRTAEFSPNGDLIVTTNSIGEARVWNANDGELGPLFHGAGNILSAQFSPDGRFVLTTENSPTAILWDAYTGATVSVFSSQGAALTAARFSSLGDRMVTVDAMARIRIWYTNGISSSVVLSSSVGSIQRLEWSPDDQLILAMGAYGLAVWDTESGKQLYSVTSNPGQAPVWDAHFTPYGKQLVMTGRGSIRVLDAFTGKPIRTLDGTDTDSILLSPDGAYLLAGKVLWKLQTGQVIARFAMENGLVAQFSSTGHYLLTYNDPKTLNVWDMRSGQWPPPLATSIRMNSYAHAARLSPYGQTLVTVDLDGLARVWAVRPDDNLPSDYQSLLLLALTRVTRMLTCQERQTYLQDTVPCATPTP